jgi:outer membrane protein OmpA-like peptidoglycan-associated protein
MNLSSLGSRSVLLVSAVFALLGPAPASAGEFPAARATLERLRLTPFGEGLAVHGVSKDLPRRFHLGLVAHYASGPVVGFADGEPVRDVVTDRFTFDLVGGFRVDSWLELGWRLPVILQDGSFESVAPGLDTSLESFGVGDPEIALRAALLRPEDAGVGLALIAGGSFPATGGGSFLGERGSAFTPTLALTRPIGERVILGLDLGGTVRWDDEHADPLGGGDELFASLGGRVDLGGVAVMAELLSSTGARKPFEEDQVAVEALGGLRAPLGGGFHGTVGGGVGLVDGYGVPEYRVLAGIGWVMGEVARRGPEPEANEEFARQTLKEAGLLGPAPRPVASSRTAPEPEPAPAPAVEQPAPVVETPAPAVARPATKPAPVEPRPATVYRPAKKEKLVIHFEAGQTELSSEAKRQLDALLSRIGSDAQRLKWRVEGHTDALGPPVPNRHVSRARAEAVSKYLRSRGLPDAWHEGWFGESDPVADNDTPSGRAQNRRVELVVTVE